MNLLDHLLNNMKLDEETGCWIWTKALCNGYGYIRTGHKVQAVHRVAYNLLVGTVPEGLELDHVKAAGCISRACFNPDHLEPVTHKENVIRGWNGRSGVMKTHCKRGHEFTQANTRITPIGRRCRACASIHTQACKKRKKAHNV